MASCRWCGAPIKHSKTAGGWLHSLPLGQLRVGHWEVLDVRLNPIGPCRPLKRETVLHPAQPA